LGVCGPIPREIPLPLPLILERIGGTPILNGGLGLRTGDILVENDEVMSRKMDDDVEALLILHGCILKEIVAQVKLKNTFFSFFFCSVTH